MLLGTLLIAVTGLLIFCLGELVVFKRTVEKELHASPFADTPFISFSVQNGDNCRRGATGATGECLDTLLGVSDA
jgi:hypothetical protein